MINDIVIVLCLAMIAEAITEIVVASEFPLFHLLRTYLASHALPDTPRNNYNWVVVYKLFSCGYCFSVWTAGLCAIFAPSLFEHQFVNWVCMTFLIHRLSNLFHVAYELLRKGRVQGLELYIIHNEDKEEEDVFNLGGKD